MKFIQFVSDIHGTACCKKETAEPQHGYRKLGIQAINQEKNYPHILTKWSQSKHKPASFHFKQ